MLKLPSQVRLELKVIPQQRESPRRHDNKVIARRDKLRLGAAASGTMKPGSPKFFHRNFKKVLTRFRPSW
jgi:hypothetical protein